MKEKIKLFYSIYSNRGGTFVLVSYRWNKEISTFYKENRSFTFGIHNSSSFRIKIKQEYNKKRKTSVIYKPY